MPAGLGEGQIAEFVEDDEVHAGEIVGHAALAAGAGFGLELVDEIDDVEEAAASAGTDAGPGDRDGEMGLAGPGAAGEDDIALMGQEVAAGEIVDECFVDRRVVEGEVGDVLGERQLGDGDLILDRTSLLLGDLGGEQVADDALGLVLALRVCRTRRKSSCSSSDKR